jgi:hypothetical protein
LVCECDQHGKLVTVDDERLNPLWETAENWGCW